MIGGTLLLYCIELIINKIIDNVRNKYLDLISIILFLVVIIDFDVTIVSIYL